MRTILGYNVEKGIKVPPPRGGSGRHPKYPFYEMKIGESFVVTEERDRIASAASYAGKRKAMKFATRVEGDGVRVWRVE